MLLKLHSETNSKERTLQWQGIMGVHGCNKFLEKKMIAFSCCRWWGSYCMHSCPLSFHHSLWAGCLSALRWTWCTRSAFLSRTTHLLVWFGILPQSVKEWVKTESNYFGVVKQLCLSPLDLKYGSASKTPYTLKAYLQSAVLKEDLLLSTAIALVCRCWHIKEGCLQRQSCPRWVFVPGPFCQLNSVWFTYVSHCRRSAPTLILWRFTMTNLTTRCGCSAGVTWRRTSLLSKWVHSSPFITLKLYLFLWFILVKWWKGREWDTREQRLVESKIWNIVCDVLWRLRKLYKHTHYFVS